MTHPTATFSWRRALLALATALALAPGFVLPHAPTTDHADSPLGVQLDRSAQHPNEPMHMERSAVEFHPGCTACLLHLQTASILVDLRAALPLPASRSAALPATQQAAVQPATRLGPARAPPAISLLSA